MLSNFYLNMFRASLCPSSGEQDRVLLRMAFCTGCAGCGCVQMGRKLCVYYQTSISTCFGHHYAHHQENKTVYYYIWCSALVVLAVVVWSWVVSCVHIIKLLSQHVSGIIMPIIRRTRPCITTYDVLHWLCWLWLCGAGS